MAFFHLKRRLFGPLPSWISGFTIHRTVQWHHRATKLLKNRSRGWKSISSRDGTNNRMVWKDARLPSILLSWLQYNAYRILSYLINDCDWFWWNNQIRNSRTCRRKKKVSSLRVCWLLWRAWSSTHRFKDIWYGLNNQSTESKRLRVLKNSKTILHFFKEILDLSSYQSERRYRWIRKTEHSDRLWWLRLHYVNIYKARRGSPNTFLWNHSKK